MKKKNQKALSEVMLLVGFGCWSPLVPNLFREDQTTARLGRPTRAGENGFTSIPESIYWAIVTITTVGYGDISPVTPLGKFIASIMMFLGYGIIAVPTGIVTTEMALAVRSRKHKHETCPGCGKEGHDSDAVFCKYCSTML